MQAAQIEPSLLERNRQLRRERDDAREQRRRWQEASAADRVENVKLRAALADICACYVARFGGDMIGLSSGVSLSRPFEIANAALEELNRQQKATELVD